jgi:hypothetical protein
VFSGEPGQLLLNAPNIVEVERKLGATRATSGSGSACTRSPTAPSSPPCRGCAATSSARCRRSSTRRRAASTSWSGCAAASATLSDALRDPDSRASVLDIVQTPAQKAVLDRLTALMTLLEGHAEFVMDGVGPR